VESNGNAALDLDNAGNLVPRVASDDLVADERERLLDEVA